MPLMNGWELQRRLSQARPAVRTLFMSGYADRALQREAPHAGATAFLQKPFDEAQLALKVRELLDG
jgi:FixJ family two-component response regulator